MIRIISWKRCLAWGWLAGLGMPWIHAEQTVLTPAADTSLFERFANNNLGKSWLSAGTLNSRHKSRALLRFDLSSLPPNAVVQAVSLELRVVKAPPGGPLSTFELRRVLELWAEGAKGAPLLRNNGAAAAAGEASWNSRGPGAWNTAGGADGSDFAAEASGTAALSGITLAFGSTASLVADVQGWLQDPDTNHGWVLKSQAETTAKSARRFGSRETANSEPMLTVEFTVPAGPNPPTLVGPAQVGEQYRFQFTAEANHAYTVERTSDAALGPWLPLTNYPALATPREIVVEDALLGTGQFYRVRSP